MNSRMVILSLAIISLFSVLVYLCIQVVTEEKQEDFVEGVVVSHSMTSEDRFGVVLFVEGSMMTYSTGAEGGGIRMCDTVRLYCDYSDSTRCVARELLDKFVGTEDECISSLIERGILSD